MSLLSPLHPVIYGPLGHPLNNEGGRFFDILGPGSTFTRSSEGSYYTKPPTDDEGDVTDHAFLAWASSNVPRIDSRDGVPMVLLEGARTNYFSTSRDLGSMLDVGAPTLTDNTDGAPDGDATSRRVECDSGEAHYKATAGLTTGQPYTGSIWMRGLPSQSLPQVFRVSAGAPDAALPASPPTATWRRVAITTTPSGTSVTIFGNEGRNTSGFGGLVAGARDGMFAFPQVEGGTAPSGNFPTSVIRTTGVSATRASDRLEWAAGTWPIGITRGGIRIVWRPLHSSAEAVASVNAQMHMGIAGGVADGLRWTTSSGMYVVVGGAVRVSSVLTWSAGQEITVEIRPAAGTMTISGATTGNGVFSGASWSAAWEALHASSVLYLGSRSGTSEHTFCRYAQSWRLL